MRGSSKGTPITIFFKKTKSLAFEEKSWASKIYMG
jgi:hypothetical protein